jgi:PAS domain S-box-containing protein
MLTGVIRDVEERVQLARRLEEEMAHLRAIVESSGATIVLTDRDLRVVMVNSELSALAGVSPDDAIGRPLSSIIEHPVDEATLARWTGGPLESPQPVRFTHALKDAQGQQRIINITANPVLDDDKVVRNIVFLGVDDTARRETELQLFDAERMRGIGEMAATVAHEVNQPLQVIRLATEVTIEEMGEAATRGEKVDEGFVQGKLERIMAQVERASRLVKELRAHSRSTYGEAAQAFDPAQAVRGAVDLTHHLVQQEAIAFTLNLPATLPLVYGHVGRLEQVLINLVNNARDSLAEIPVRDARRRIVLSAAGLQKDGREYLQLAVEDSGPGIADHVLPRLFVPFVTTKARGKGTGLGLPLCQRIVEEMGGTISAANRTEGGARFEILLPATSVRSLPRVA